MRRPPHQLGGGDRTLTLSIQSGTEHFEKVSHEPTPRVTVEANTDPTGILIGPVSIFGLTPSPTGRRGEYPLAGCACKRTLPRTALGEKRSTHPPAMNGLRVRGGRLVD